MRSDSDTLSKEERCYFVPVVMKVGAESITGRTDVAVPKVTVFVVVVVVEA